MSKFLSGRLRRLLVGITGYTENNTVVQTTGKVGIGTTDAQQHSLFVVGSTNITGDTIVGGGLTAVGIGSFQSDVYIDNQLYVGGVNITGGAGGGSSFAGVVTFTDTTDNTLGDPDTGAVQIDGGLGVNKNVTVGAGLSVVSGFNVAGVSTFQGNVFLGDDDQIRLGASTDLKIYHDSSNTLNIIEGTTGDVEIRSSTNVKIKHQSSGDDYAVFNEDGSVELYYDNSKKFETTGAGVTVFGTTFSNQLNISGVSTFQGNAFFGDNDELTFGDGNDLVITSNGSNAQIRSSGGAFINYRSTKHNFRNQAGTEQLATFTADGSVELYYDNSKKFETTGIGVSVLSGAGLTATIAGPANLIIDPGTVGDDTGLVRIKGDLYVDGTEFIVNSSTIDLADLKVGIATTVSTNLLLDGGGIGIGDPSIEKTLLWNNSNSRMEFNADLYAPNFTTGNINLTNLYVSGLSTFAGITTVTGPTLFTKQLNVSGVSTFQNNVQLLDNDKLLIGGSVGSHDGLEIYHDTNHSYIDDSGTGNLYLRSGTLAIQNLAGSKTSALFQSGGGQEFYHNNTKRLETTGYGVTVYNDLRVGTGVTVYGNVGIVSAYQFWGDGSNLSNTGATLSAAAGTQRLVLTSLTSGTMVSAATDSDLSYNATTDTLNLENIDLDGHAELDQLRVSGVSTFQGRIVGAATSNVIPFLYANYSDLPSAGTYHGAFAHVHAAGKAYFAHANAWYELVNKDLNGVVGTGTETYNIANINITGITTLGGPVTAGSSEGVNGQYLRHVGTGVTWANFPTLRTTQTTSASDNQTTFNFTYNVNFLDVFVNGVKLTSSEYTATNGSQVILDSPAFAGDIVEFHSYNTASTYGGGG